MFAFVIDVHIKITMVDKELLYVVKYMLFGLERLCAKSSVYMGLQITNEHEIIQINTNFNFYSNQIMMADKCIYSQYLYYCILYGYLLVMFHFMLT